MDRDSSRASEPWPAWESARVLTEGLPRLPHRLLPPGVEVPVATWSEGSVAAVLYVGADEEESYSQLDYSIELLRREGAAWRVESRGGNDWIADDLWIRPPGQDVWMARGTCTTPASGGRLWHFRCGLVGSGVKRLRFRSSGSEYDYDIASVVGAWVAGVLVSSGGSIGTVDAFGEAGGVLSCVDLSLSSWP